MPRLVYIAGVNGAGKTTLSNSLDDVNNMPSVNTDEIVKTIGNWQKQADVLEAGKIAVRKIRENIDQGISFKQETTLCGKTAINNIDLARAKGFQIEVHYIGLESAEIAKERVRHRVLAGGHGISENDIERRYIESFRIMRMILEQCDSAYFYDNTVEFRLFARYQLGTLVWCSRNLPEWYEKWFQ